MIPRSFFSGRENGGNGVVIERALATMVITLACGAVSCYESRIFPIQALDASGLAPDGVDAGSDAPNAPDLADGPAPELPVGFTCPTALVGFGATGGGTTGGGNVQPVVANTLAELMMHANTNDDPQVIEIRNVIAVTDQVRVKSNKTIRGTVAGAGLVGGGLNLTDSHNVIVQRMTISNAVATDAVSVTNAQNVWIDHCDLSSDLIAPKGTYDGLVDITHASTNVTVSWNTFRNHYNPSLVGHSANNAAEDTGALTVTYHHNWFANTPNNTPRVRFGAVHVFNNLFQDIDSAIASQMGAQVFVEGNVFQRVLRPIMTRYEDPVEGMATEVDNVFDLNHPPQIFMSATWRPAAAYTYRADPSYIVPLTVQTCAGAKF